MEPDLANRIAANAIGTASTRGPINAENLLHNVRLEAARVGYAITAEIPENVMERSAARFYDALGAWIAQTAQ